MAFTTTGDKAKCNIVSCWGDFGQIYMDIKKLRQLKYLGALITTVLYGRELRHGCGEGMTIFVCREFLYPSCYRGTLNNRCIRPFKALYVKWL